MTNIPRSEHFKTRIIEKNSEECKRLEQDKGAIELVFSDPSLSSPVPMKIHGFSHTKDNAGNPILYFKPKEKDRVILIHKTDHPDVDKSIAILTEYADMNEYTIVDLETHAKEMLGLAEKIKEERNKK